jgi:hypothetical protein
MVETETKPEREREYELAAGSKDVLQYWTIRLSLLVDPEYGADRDVRACGR